MRKDSREDYIGNMRMYFEIPSVLLEDGLRQLDIVVADQLHQLKHHILLGLTQLIKVLHLSLSILLTKKYINIKIFPLHSLLINSQNSPSHTATAPTTPPNSHSPASHRASSSSLILSLRTTRTVGN